MSPSRLLAISLAFALGLATAGDAPAAPFVLARDAQCVAYSPDGKWIAAGMSGESSGEATPRPHPNPRKCAVVFIHDAATGEKLRRMETYGDFTRVEFSPDSRFVAAARLFSPDGDLQLNEVRLWNPATGEVVRRFDRCHAFAFAHDGKSLAILSRTKCVVYDTATWQKRGEIEPLGGAVAIAYSHESELLIGIIHRDGKTLIRFCDAVSGTQLAESILLVNPFYTLAVSPAGRYLATGHVGGIVAVWDLTDVPREPLLPGEEPRPLRPALRLEAEANELMHPFYSPDGTKLAAGGQESATTVIWEAASGRPLGKLLYDRGAFRPLYRRAADALVRPERDPNRFCFTPDGEAILAGCHGGVVRRWADGGEVRKLGD